MDRLFGQLGVLLVTATPPTAASASTASMWCGPGFIFPVVTAAVVA